MSDIYPDRSIDKAIILFPGLLFSPTFSGLSTWAPSSALYSRIWTQQEEQVGRSGPGGGGFRAVFFTKILCLSVSISYFWSVNVSLAVPACLC